MITHQKQALILFDQWNNAIETKDPDTVTELYADDAILLPTLSNTICNSHEKIKNYFISFLKKGLRVLSMNQIVENSLI